MSLWAKKDALNYERQLYIVGWRGVSRRGINPAHLSESYKQMSKWNATCSIRIAMTVEPNTAKVIEYILRSHEYEVQAYCLCVCIFGYAKMYRNIRLQLLIYIGYVDLSIVTLLFKHNEFCTADIAVLTNGYPNFSVDFSWAMMTVKIIRYCRKMRL